MDEGLVILGVFDGHGLHGHDVSDFIHTFIPEHLHMCNIFTKKAITDIFELA